MGEDYRGHRIETVNAGESGWRAYVDLYYLGICRSRISALEMAQRWVDDALWSEYLVRHGPRRPTPLRAVPVLRLVHDADAK